MRLPITLSEIGPRISAGAFILNSGLGKRDADEGTAAGLHGFASGTYPFLKDVDPKTFVKALAYAEIGVGAALLTPLVPTALAGALLTGFSGGLLGLYLNTPACGSRAASRRPPRGSRWPRTCGCSASASACSPGATVDRGPRRVRKAAKTLAKANKKVARASEKAARRAA
jgi:hypothetical protein